MSSYPEQEYFTDGIFCDMAAEERRTASDT